MFELDRKHYLLLVDYYSGWIEVRRLDSLSSTATIEVIKSIFSTHGICEMVISDNGPQFAAQEFHQFTDCYGFTHVTSFPWYNGEAEWAVGTIKRM